MHFSRLRKKRRRLLWLPTIVIFFTALFHVESVAVVTHVLHPNAESLGAYRISIPLLWHIDFPWHWSGDSKLIQLYRSRGLAFHGPLHYLRHQPSISSIDLANTNARDHLLFREGDMDWNCKLLEQANLKINCCVDPFNKKHVHAKCWTVDDELGNQSLEATFYGSQKDASEFYTLLKTARRMH